MHRDEVGHVAMYVSLGLQLLAGILYFVPIISWKVPLVSGLLAFFVMAWIFSIPGKPEKLTPELAALNVTRGSFHTKTGLLLVGDSWAPKENKDELKLTQPGGVEFAVTLKDRVVTEVRLGANDDNGFEPTETTIAVDSGHVVFLDAAWEERGLSEKCLYKDVQAVLRSPEPLHLVLMDSSGEPAGVVVGSGLGDGLYVLKAEGAEARIQFEPDEEPPDQDDG